MTNGFDPLQLILPAMVLVCCTAVALGALRGWSLVGDGFSGMGAGGLFRLALSWFAELLFPGTLFALNAVLLVVYGRTYGLLRSRRRTGRPARGS